MSLTNDKNPRVEVTKIFADYEHPMTAAVEWAQSIATSRGINPSKDQVVFIRELRREEPSLSLKSAVYLAQMTEKAVRTEHNADETGIKSLLHTDSIIP
ncbi:hypothetical protein [Bifidobacterium asteroides]|uniref:hypothetical protein n=1 Tax=Bifidobacterium asteroides TaxID=1684 RepID=UPI0027412272|nr:hypothetical protein [Bifidobacterium asteroides]WLT09987.1 hypothetical protein RAM15_04475 [Bifidobacterium asteroides]